MALQYRCANEVRLLAVRESDLNAIEYLEVLDLRAPEGSPRQRTLLVHLVKEVPAGLTRDQVRIEGGVRVRNVGIGWAFPAQSIPAELLTDNEEEFFANLGDAEKILTIRSDSDGDFSTYTLYIQTSPTELESPSDFDPQLSHIEFSFKVECPSDFDCKAREVCPPERLSEPVIDYLAKDYASFRRLMLDRLAVINPDWTERSPADAGVALVELLAYVADHLSYYQDAVATEAYLGTARKRVSVRRHARLLDYPMHDGCNARAWVHIDVEPGGGFDGWTLPPGSVLITRIDPHRWTLEPGELGAAVSAGAQVFETLHEIELRADRNEMRFYTWGDDECCLPRGATRATLRDEGGALRDLEPGSVLVFEEVTGAESGEETDSDPEHRHAVRLTEAEPAEDPLFSENPDDPSDPQRLRVVNIAWAPEDALPFPLCLREFERPDEPGKKLPVSVARGNVVLVDHGRTISGEELEGMVDPDRYRPRLEQEPVTQQAHVRERPSPERLVRRLVPFDPSAPASEALRWDMRRVKPAVKLIEDGQSELVWLPQRDLLNSDRFAREFVVEVEDDGRSYLRFGDDVMGRRPEAGSRLEATYRIGNGRAGNVGAEAIAHLVTADPGIRRVRNPMPAQGGTNPEPMESVRLYAPQAFRTQERAVTATDYAGAAERHPQVQKAAATLRWTGSWHTMFVTVDRKGGRPVDDDFRGELIDFLGRFRTAGLDLEVDAPRFVPLDIAFTVCVAPGYFRSDVKQALLERFSNQELPDGRRGFFHPDNFTFGQSLFLSQVIAAAMEVPGVVWVDAEDTPDKPNRFRRLQERPAAGEVLDRLTFGRLEIAQLDNDPNAPENGKIEFFMQGGL